MDDWQVNISMVPVKGIESRRRLTKRMSTKVEWDLNKKKRGFELVKIEDLPSSNLAVATECCTHLKRWFTLIYYHPTDQRCWFSIICQNLRSSAPPRWKNWKCKSGNFWCPVCPAWRPPDENVNAEGLKGWVTRMTSSGVTLWGKSFRKTFGKTKKLGAFW